MNDRQKRFCLEYLKDFNATKAAERAGYSKKTANRIGSENLSKLDIKKEIERLKKKQVEKSELKVADIIDGFKDIAFSVFEKTSDRLKALEMLGKYLGIFKESEQRATVINVVNKIRN